MIYKSNTHIIFVLGMHRSGTSAVIRGLQVLGVGLGDKLMPPKQDNKKGFFEDLDINEFNIMLMRELGHDWHSLAPLSVEEITGSIAQRFKIQAMELMRLKIDASPLFGVKDPRITRLLPFWQDVAKSLEAQVSYIIVCRNPRSVVQSLAKRNGFDLEKGYYLWLDYTLSSLNYTAGQKPIVVDYDNLMADPGNQLRRIADNIGLVLNTASTEFKEYEIEYLDDGLRHTHFVFEDLILDKASPPVVIELYRLLSDLAADKIAPDSQKLNSRLSSINKKFKIISNILTYHQAYDKKLASLELELIESKNQIAGYKQVVIEREKQIAERDDAIAGYKQVVIEREKQIAERDDAIAGYKQVVIEREKQIAERDDAIAGYKQVVIERDITAQNISIELAASKALIEEITNSTAWKLVQHLWGFRTSLLPHGSRREAIGKFSLHFFHSLASKATTSLWGLRKIAIRQVARNSKEIFDKPIKRMHNTAVILHLYYPDLWDEIKSYLLNLEGDFDLYISMPFNVKIKTKDVLSFHPETYIYRCKNQGRDIAPFLRIFNEISSLNYQYICKLHTKKTLSATIGNEWRKDLYNKLLGSSGIVRLVKKTFDENRPGLIAPCGHLLSTKNKLYMGNNEKKIRELSENAGIPYQGEDFLFVAGSMFWFSMEGLNPSMFTGIKQEDFEAEQGATDNALPHAIERFFGWVVHCSQKPVFISTGTNIHRLDSTNPATMPIYDWGK